MSIRHRLLNLARAELRGLADRVAERALFSPLPRPKAHAPRTETTEVPLDPHAQKIKQYYANLELPPGASWSQVKRAYRRLMRQYHPDRHHADAEKERLANELSQKLRDAYEGLRKELKAER